MIIVPLQPVPNQTLTVVLGGQNCRINIYQKFFGLYCDLSINGAAPILLGRICQTGNLLVRYAYLGFIGDLTFIDTQVPVADPAYAGLGARWQLAYLTPADIAALPAAA
jgi:hypothetical protein